MRRRFLPLLAAVALVAAFAGPSNAGTAVMVGGITNVGPHANSWCRDQIPWSMYGPLRTGYGTSSLTASDTMVGGVFVLRGGPPNTVLEVRLIQAVPDVVQTGQCWHVDAYVLTDGAGNATVSIREPRDPYATAVNLFSGMLQYTSPETFFTYSGQRPLTFSPQLVPAPSGGAGAQTNLTTARR
jgi:hypothetical protein